MAKRQAKTAETPKTTAQQLGSLIKSARDIMRKDKGLNGDLDRLPLLTWIMFLKFLDDLEKHPRGRGAIGGKKYKPADRDTLSLARLGSERRTASPAMS